MYSQTARQLNGLLAISWDGEYTVSVDTAHTVCSLCESQRLMTLFSEKPAESIIRALSNSSQALHKTFWTNPSVSSFSINTRICKQPRCDDNYWVFNSRQNSTETRLKIHLHFLHLEKDLNSASKYSSVYKKVIHFTLISTFSDWIYWNL